MDKCLECEVKDAEINMLYRRIQLLANLLALQLNSLQQQQPGSTSGGGAGVVEGESSVAVFSHILLPSVYAPPAAPPAEPQRPKDDPGMVACCAKEGTVSSENKSPEMSGSVDGGVELMAGSGVYVSLRRLGRALATSSSGTQLARKLMAMLWDRETLACSSPSPRPQSHYHPLDPGTVRAIEEYCLSFDKSSTPGEILSSMHSKCYQARISTGF